MSAPKPVFLASDVHLGAARSGRERDFFAWLEHVGDAASRVILNGDLFDFWFEYRTGPTRGHEDVLSALRATIDGGVPVTLMGGNHDWWGGRYLREEVGVEFLQDPVVREIAGKRALLAHGDGLGTGDASYLALRAVLRSPVTRWAYAWLPPSLGDGIARGVSRTERKWDDWGEKQRARCAALASWARTRLEEDRELELVLLGHTHEPCIQEVAPGRWYVNSGDWVRNRSYVVLAVDREPAVDRMGKVVMRGGHGPVVGLLLLLAAVPPSGTAAQQTTPPEPSPLLEPLPISPGGAFLRSVLLPGWGHAAIGSYTRGGFYFALDAATIYAFLRTRQRLTEARERADFYEGAVRSRLAQQNITDPEELEAAIEADETLLSFRALVESRESQQEDLIAWGIFLLFLSGADAYVSTHLGRFPDPIQVEMRPLDVDRADVALKVLLPNFP